MKLKACIAALFAILLAATPAGSGSMSLLGAGKASGAAAPYSGPGDSQAFVLWGSVARAYNAAYAVAGTNPAADLVASTGGATVCTLRIATTGLVDLSNNYCSSTTPALACAAASGGSCKVSKLYDQVGTNHWTQATLSQMPTLAFSAINGLPALSFASASSQIMVTGSTLTQLWPAAMEAVAQRNANFTSGQTIIAAHSPETDLFFLNSANTVAGFSGSLTSAPATDGVPHVLQICYDIAQTTLNVDGATQVIGSGAPAGSFTDTISVGGYVTSLYLDGYISEAGIYGGSYSAGVQSNARSRYGL